MNIHDRSNICRPDLPVDLERLHFTLPILTKEQYTNTPRHPSAFQRALELVNDLVQAFNCGCLKNLQAGRRQLYDWLLWGDFDGNHHGGYIHVPDDESRETVLRNLLEAALSATEEWELAMVITPYLLPENARSEQDDCIRENRQRISHVG